MGEGVWRRFRSVWVYFPKPRRCHSRASFCLAREESRSANPGFLARGIAPGACHARGNDNPEGFFYDHIKMTHYPNATSELPSLLPPNSGLYGCELDRDGQTLLLCKR